MKKNSPFPAAFTKSSTTGDILFASLPFFPNTDSIDPALPMQDALSQRSAIIIHVIKYNRQPFPGLFQAPASAFGFRFLRELFAGMQKSGTDS